MISTSMIDHSDQVLVCLGELCTSVDYSDVTFLVQNEQIPAHRAILAARSEYFRALLYGGLKESNQSKITLDVSSTAFKQLLRYIYTGSSELKGLEVDEILTLLGLAHQYGITAFVKAISDHLYGVLTVANVCTIADEARLLDLVELSDKCYEFIDRNACSVIKHDSLSNLSFDTLVMVLGRERFKRIEEIEIFQAVHKWCQNNDVAEEKKTYLYGRVRYTAISRNNLLQIVRPAGVVNTEHLLNIISIQYGIDLHRYQPPPGKTTNKDVAANARVTWIMAGQGHRAYFDLRKPYLINNVHLTLVSNEKLYKPVSSPYRPVAGQERLSVSPDGASWSTVFVGTSSTSLFTLNTSIDFPIYQVRYIRFETPLYTPHSGISLSAMLNQSN